MMELTQSSSSNRRYLTLVLEQTYIYRDDSTRPKLFSWMNIGSTKNNMYIYSKHAHVEQLPTYSTEYSDQLKHGHSLSFFPDNIKNCIGVVSVKSTNLTLFNYTLPLFIPSCMYKLDCYKEVR